MDAKEQQELLREYVEYANEFLDELDGQFLELEKSVGREPEAATLAKVLSNLHTFKGCSGMMGYESIQKFSHRLEDVFKALQDKSLQLTHPLIEKLLKSASLLRNTVGSIAAGKGVPGAMSDEFKIFNGLRPDENESDMADDPHPLPAGEETAKITAAENIKVNFQKLDHLLNLVGELVIFNNKLNQLGVELRSSFGETKGIAELNSASEHMAKVTGEIHESIMRIRMIPLRTIFQRFPRFVRDTAKECGKDVNIFFEGEDTQLDKKIIDQIGEPLIHMLRNSIDHGIESVADRVRAGKTPQGTILVKAYQESNYIIICVEDNGAGIDEDKLKIKAAEAGILADDTISQRDLLDLIFISGISTATKVSEISGRGIGMDIVKKSIAKLNGNIMVESERGVGTRFTIKLPLTLAIASALMISVLGEQYAIPLASVLESIKIKSSEIHLINNAEVIKFRGRVLPLLRLRSFFGFEEDRSSDTNYVVIVQSTSRQIGLIVDRLVGQSEIVIKGLDDYINDSIGISGATIMGDGRVVLIIDIDKIMENLRHEFSKIKRVDSLTV